MEYQHNNRWRFGETNQVEAAVDAETVIYIGDLIYQEYNDARPASAHPFTNSYDEMKAYVAKRFLGVAMQASRSGETMPVKVATTGFYEFDADYLNGELGDLIGVDRSVVNSDHQKMRLQNQRVCLVQMRGQAIGRLARREPKNVRSVLVQIRSAVMSVF